MEKMPPLLSSTRKRRGGVKYQQFLKEEKDENGKNVSKFGFGSGPWPELSR